MGAVEAAADLAALGLGGRRRLGASTAARLVVEPFLAAAPDLPLVFLADVRAGALAAGDGDLAAVFAEVRLAGAALLAPAFALLAPAFADGSALLAPAFADDRALVAGALAARLSVGALGSRVAERDRGAEDA